MDIELVGLTVDMESSRSLSCSSASAGTLSSVNQQDISADLRGAVRYLSELVGSYDAETLCRACQNLAEIIKRADGDCLLLLLERDVVSVIKKMMAALPSHSSAQQAGCDAILSCNEIVELRSSLEKHNAFRLLLTAMKSHPKDTELLKKALRALASLVVSAVDEIALKESVVYVEVLKAISEHADNVDIQAGGLLALASLLELDSYAASSIALQGDADVIVADVKRHFSDPAVVTHGFHCLRVIVRSVVGSGKLPEMKDNLEYIVTVLLHYPNNEDIATAALGLIQAIYSLELGLLSEYGSSHNHSREEMKFPDVLQLTSQSIDRFRDLPEVQLYGFNCLSCVFSLSNVNVSNELLDNWLKLLNIALSYHSENTEICETCCRCLSQLLTSYDQTTSRIGDEEDQIPLHSHLWMILLNLSYKPSSDLFIAVCGALHCLIEYDGTYTLQQLLLKKGAATALLECLRGYIGEEVGRCVKCVECGCQALKGILMHHCSDDQKQYLLDIGIFADLQSILDSCIHDASVITEAFCVIACLSDMSNFQETVIAHSLYKGILECVEKHISKEVLVEVALEIFIILSLNTDMIQCLNDVDSLGITVSIMRKHVTSSSIQFKGCILIRLLCDPKHLVSVSDSLCTTVANVVVDALSRKMDTKVQSEALACGEVLSKCSYQMAKALVKGDIHILLFTLLYREEESMKNGTKAVAAQLEESNVYSPPCEDDQGDKVKEFFLQVGTEIIFTLSYSWDFKQAMLTTTIRDGVLEGVNILVDIGADVNFGENQDTPLCVAVQSKDKKTVECLLEHNITNVNVREALKLSWELKEDFIAGLLLEHIAVDRSRDAVNLSGLELDTIKPLWILPSLGVKSLPQERQHQRHKRERSLGHVKELLSSRRKSVATGNPFELERAALVTAENSDMKSRRVSVQLSSLKYVSDAESASEVDEVDFVSTRTSKQSLRDIQEHDGSHLHSIMNYQAHETESPSIMEEGVYPEESTQQLLSSCHVDDSGVETLRTLYRRQSSGSSRSESLTEGRSENQQGRMSSRGSLSGRLRRTVSGAATLPHCTLEQYTGERKESESSISSTRSVHARSVRADGDSTLSPAQLIRKYRKRPKKTRKQLFGDSLGSSYQADSPVPVMYYVDQLEGVQESVVSPDHTFPPDWPFSPSSISISGASSDLSSSNDILRSTSSQDEVDFSGYRPTLKESSFNEQRNSHLIKILDLSSNKLCNFSDLCYREHGGVFVFKQLKELSSLDLKQNKLSELAKHMMQHMDRLVRIDLSCNNFSIFPIEAMQSANLTDIDLSANQISEVPVFPLMHNLTRFNLSNNQLTVMPECVSKVNGRSSFPHLKYFYLRGNQISTVPKRNVHFCDLEVLNMSQNKITELPDEFLVSMPSLRILDASMNEISSIGGEVGQDMVQLEELKLSGNNLSATEAYLNKFITSLPVLRSVDVSENGLTLIPPPHAWKSLGVKEIKYTSNKLTKVDLSEGKRFWSHLESFYIGQNKIKEIPKEIGQLRCLTCLDISHNKDIRHLPGELGDLDHLFVLNLQGLKNLLLDPNVMNGPVKGIVSYLKSRHKRSVPYYHMKMMIVGAAERGKTTLLHHLIQTAAPSSNSKANVATMGVNVKQWNYQHKKPGGNVFVTYHVNCWDFAGQEEFYSTHQCFLSRRSLYVLVYNFFHGEAELRYLEPWLLNIQARAPSSVVLIVGTHMDYFKLPQLELDRKRREMRSKVKDMLRNPGFPIEVSFFELNCFNEKQMRELRTKVQGLIDSAKIRGQKIMGGLVPLSYIELEDLIQKEKKRLEKSRFPVLQECHLQELMEESKLNLTMDRSELQQAVKFLHESGVILHYSDLQTKLSELYFLDPEWLCTLMAHVITFKHISFVDDKGFMQEKAIPHVLKEPRFPQQFLSEYMRLLERFEVVLRHTEEKLLIPTRLPKNKPPEVYLPPVTPGSQLVRRYVMCYIPPGFWPRLTARLIAFPKRAYVEGTAQPATLHVWSGGVYMYWSETSYYLLELCPRQVNTFDIIVPITISGTQLLCEIVDNVEALVDEWFPGLRDLSVFSGADLMKPMSICPLCPADVVGHCFLLKDLLQCAVSVDVVECPVHKGLVKLELLAPDIIIGDLDPKYKITREELALEEIAKNVLGKGGFGSVYKAHIQERTVAVKVFLQSVAAISNTTPNQLIRQEVQILSKLHHPHIISLVGVCLRPKAMLVLEYAELGSLSSMKPYSNMSMPLKHRIALQISSALAFLHKNRIIYRDLKPGNVLLFSLSTLVKVNAKLSDYGIACFATASGLTQSVGTAGYRAPELLLSSTSSMPYYHKVDIYSFGLMLFELMTNGHKPFEELSSGHEIDKFILQGRPINDIDHYGGSSWPDMQDLINHCLQYTPGKRPAAQELFDRMCTSEFVALKKAISIERDHTVETFTFRLFTDKHHTKNTELWVVSILGTQSMLSILNLTQRNSSAQGMMMQKGTLIFSMLAVDSSLMLMGSNKGYILVYDGFEKKLKHTLRGLDDSILCLIHIKPQKDGVYYICAGLANGHLVFYDNELILTPNAMGQDVPVGNGPVKSMKRYHNRLYVACGTDIVILKISDRQVEKRWTIIKKCESSNFYLTNVEVGLNSIWTAQNKSPTLNMWDQHDGTSTGDINCKAIVNSVLPPERALSTYEARITSLLLQQSPHSMLWVGLGSGHLLIFNANSQRLLMTTKRHIQSVRCLQLVKTIFAEKPVNYVISGGFGFQQRPGYNAPTRGTPETYGSLLVWDSIMPRLKTDYDTIKKEMNRYR